VKDESQAKEIWNKTLNARGETIFEKPSFRDSAKKSRCVIPLDGFYEHHHKGGKTFPYYIQRKDKESLLVGGLTSEWVNEVTGEIIKSMTILTTPGNELMKEIHNNPKLKEARMPFLLEDKDARLWLEGEENEVKGLIKPNLDQKLEAHTVRRLRGSNYVGNCQEAQEEFDYDELIEPPTLF
jgi:putative SOS response-associated peptidase YedK